MNDDAVLLTYVAALFSMMNPIGNVGIFASMTADRSPEEAKRVAWKCMLAIGITLVVVTWTGSALLQFFGIDVHQLRAAGGIIVLRIALSMLNSDHTHQQTKQESKDAANRDSIAIVPLAIPIVSGPGSIATVIVASERHSGIWAKVDLSITAIALAIFVGLVFSFSRPIATWLGESGMGVVSRLMGMVLAAIAMGMLVNGLTGMIPALGVH